METQTYRTIIRKDGNAYHGFVPALPGCHTCGRTIEETQRNLKEAISAWIVSRHRLGWAIPEDDLIEILQTVNLPTPKSQTAYA